MVRGGRREARTVNVIIVGAGVFGAWCAWFLAARGYRVTLLDAYGAANPRASSSDHSRVVRCGYGADAIYSQWAHNALDDWRWLSRETDRELLVPSGALFMGAAGDQYIHATHNTLLRLGIRSEQLEAAEISRRYPQIDPVGIGSAVFEPDAGVIRARAAVQALIALMIRRQAVMYRLGHVMPPDESRAQPEWRLTTGEPIEGDLTICACGPWLPALFPHAVGARVRPTRQEVLFYGVPAGSDGFSLARLPVWIDFSAGLYGIPDFDGRGFKIGIDRHGASIDPDTAERLVDPSVVASTRDRVATRFPKLQNAPFVDGHVCQYENTSSGDFIIDRHPQWPNVWIVGGGSGHGFKHGPSVGRYVAGVVSGETLVEGRFSLTTKATHSARAVY